MNKKFFSTQIILGVFIVSLAALSSVSAADWTPPPADPPGGWSLGAPIYSEGLTNQTIKGTLQIQSTGAYDLILNSIKSSAGDKYINLTGGGLRVDNSNVADIGLSVLTAQGNVGANQQLGYLVGLTNVGNGKGLYVSGAGTAIYGESTNQAVHGKINGAAAGSVAIYGENTLGTWAGYFLGDSAFQGRAAVTPDANFAFFNAGLQDGDLAAGRLCLITGAGGVNCINSWNGLGGGGGSSDSLWQLAGGILTPTSTANELTVTRGIINGGTGDLFLNSDSNAQIRIDADANGVNNFQINNGGNTTIFSVNETGNLSASGTIQGNFVAYNGATCASDQILKKSGANWTCQDYGGGGGTPGGADTQVQFNNGGSFTGDAGLIYNSSTDSLIVSGTIYATSTQLGSSNLNLASNENLLYGNIDTASQGNLLLLQTEGSDMFKVDSVGTSTIKGNLVLSRNPNGYRKIYAQDNSGAVMNATGLKIFGGSAVSCFAAETKITTPDGVVAIKDLKAGDKVVSYDPDQKKYVTTKIKEVFVRPADNYYVLNGIIRVTSEHPFYTKTGWKTVRELMPNDELFTSNGWQPVVSKVFVNQSLTVYNMHVDEPNTYFAEGVLVHNKAPGNGGDVYLYGGRASGRVNNDYQGYIGPSDGRMGNVVLGHDGTNPFGSVGIETNDPQYGFDVATLTRFQGSVGIGTAPPQGIILDVAGDANFRGMLGIEGTLVPTGGILIADGHGDGKVLTSDAYGMATWQNSAGGGGNPAGNDGELQFNNSGSFGADPKLKFYSAVDELWLNTRVRAKYLWVAPYSPAGWNSDGDGYFSHNVHVGGSLIVTGFTATGTVALPTGAITSAMILNSTITGTDIANSTITGTKIAASTINGSNIAAGTITGSNISTATSLTVATSYVGGMTQLGNSTPALVAGQNLLYGNISGSSSGGNLILLQNNFADKFSVDKDGNTTIGGTLDFGYEQVTGSLIGNCGQASCSAGKKVISGGVNCSASNITASYPNSDSSWTGCCSGTGSNVYAVCGRIKTGGTGG